jgi:hypothetical protein
MATRAVLPASLRREASPPHATPPAALARGLRARALRAHQTAMRCAAGSDAHCGDGGGGEAPKTAVCALYGCASRLACAYRALH